MCAGIKDVENRSWKTNYRGTLHIHTSGDDWFIPFFDEMSDCMKLHAEMARYKFANDGTPIPPKDCRFIMYDRTKDEYFLSNEGKKDKYIKAEYEFFKIYQHHIARDEVFFKAKAIIGTVDLVDIVENSQSPFAVKNCYHWILENPVLFEKPLVNVKGRLGLFNYTLGE